ncbi:hypothetical protein BpHYR1_038919 [Brachionus plicatilis]|uniref:Uncharacterized protein n=1 Tax=Brachionus plicatilis TaxID=10195 RepID=A0A3M7S030_BRAPC|nr:hypothetical protein BpHYR1_038919 [Brachionus plicatilis]
MKERLTLLDSLKIRSKENNFYENNQKLIERKKQFIISIKWLNSNDKFITSSLKSTKIIS